MAMTNRLRIASMIRKQVGFTLIELMVTLAVAAVLVAWATPNLRNLLLGNRLTAQTNDLVGTLQYARSEAAKRSSSVSVAPLSGAKTNTDWSSVGWQVFVDFDGDGVRDTTPPADIALREEAANPTNGGFPTIAVGYSPLTYRPDGSIANQFQATLCNTSYRNAKNQRKVEVTVAGAITTTPETCP